MAIVTVKINVIWKIHLNVVEGNNVSFYLALSLSREQYNQIKSNIRFTFKHSYNINYFTTVIKAST